MKYRAISLTLAGFVAAAACSAVACTVSEASPANEADTLGATVEVPNVEEGQPEITRRKVRFPARKNATQETTTPAPAPTTTPEPAPTTEPAPTEPTPIPAPTATATPTPTPPPPAPALRPVPFRGVNLAGAEFGSAIPGTENIDYQFPTNAEVDYFMAKGMNVFRVGFKWERLQRSTYAAFDATYAAHLDAVVSYAAAKGARVILNPHNFARYNNNLVGSTTVPNGAFADLWKRLAAKYAGNTNVLFNLVNEPNTMPTEQWVSAANAAIAAIRTAGAHNTIIVPGNAWTGGHSWNQTWYGTSNAVAMLNIVDPEDNIWFEAHQYLDQTAGGTDTTCVSTTAGRDRLAPFVNWLRANNKKGFIGEFAGGNNATCKTAVQDMMAYMNAQGDVLMGWLWWAAGPGWGDYPFSIEPTKTSSGMADRPLFAWLTPYL